MDKMKLESLIKNGESLNLEFKTSTSQLKNTFETVCAYLNGKGGTVLIGNINTNNYLYAANS